MMQILSLLGMYFDAVVVFVTNSSLLFRLPVVNVLAVIASLARFEHLSNIDEIPKNFMSLDSDSKWGFCFVYSCMYMHNTCATQVHHISKRESPILSFIVMHGLPTSNSSI
jgi:hypothetical protein